MDIVKQINIKEKAIKIAESCKTSDQINSAFAYLQLYIEKTEDLLGYNQIRRILLEIEEKILANNK